MIVLTPTITTLLSNHAPVAIGELLDLDVLYTDASAVEQRYAELMRGRPASELTTVQLGMMLDR